MRRRGSSVQNQNCKGIRRDMSHWIVFCDLNYTVSAVTAVSSWGQPLRWQLETAWLTRLYGFEAEQRDIFWTEEDSKKLGSLRYWNTISLILYPIFGYSWGWRPLSERWRVQLNVGVRPYCVHSDTHLISSFHTFHIDQKNHRLAESRAKPSIQITFIN